MCKIASETPSAEFSARMQREWNQTEKLSSWWAHLTAVQELESGRNPVTFKNNLCVAWMAVYYICSLGLTSNSVVEGIRKTPLYIKSEKSSCAVQWRKAEYCKLASTCANATSNLAVIKTQI